MKDKDVRLALVLWPILDFVTLYILTVMFFNVISNLKFSNTLDPSFFIALSVITLSHLISFCFIPLLLLTTRKLSSATFSTFAAIGFLLVIVHIFIRITMDRVGRLDCGNLCVDTVIPAFPGQVINTVVISLLLFCYITFFVVGKKQLKKSYPESI